MLERFANNSYYRHVTIRKNGERFEMYQPSQNKERNTEVIYGIQDNILHIAGKLIEKHPKFKDVLHLEHWASQYFAKCKDGYKC